MNRTTMCGQLVQDYSIQLPSEEEIGLFSINPFYEVRERMENLSNCKRKKLKRKHRHELSFLGNRLQKLVEAAHVINERRKLEVTPESDQH